MRGRHLAIALALGTLAGLCVAGPASADFGPIRLVSQTPTQQAEAAVAPAISADGNYLAFQGTLGDAEGIFREDILTGEIDRVATTSASTGGGFGSYATNPSISADGRYVSFTTTAQMDPDDDTQPASSDVYVADMSSSPPTYTLASALNGCDPDQATPHAPCGLTYGGSGGSEATGRVSLSANGQEVVFITSAESNLTSEPGGSTEGTPTPAGQVVLRNLETDTTTLVSAERDSATGEMTERPVPGGALVSKFILSNLRGAALSADGSTVAWLGTHLPAQVALSAAEAQTLTTLDAGQYPYDEPLWRRVGEAPSAPIRRIVAGEGAADPFPNLTDKSTNDLNATEGWLGLQYVDGVPALSSDGRTVALIGNPTEAANVFVVDMSAGRSRAQAVRQLTREIVVNASEPAQSVNKPPYLSLNGDIFDLAISGTGRRVAFTTARQRFPLAPPNLIGSPPSSVGLSELYVIDLESEALERVTHGLGGIDEPSMNATARRNGPENTAVSGVGAGAPSMGGGGFIAFSSTASNLVAGDSNEGSDAFVVEDSEDSVGTSHPRISPGPEAPRPHTGWRLSLTAFSLPDGAVRIVAGVPAAGRLHAAVAPEPGGALPARRLVVAGAQAAGSGQVPIQLRLPSRLRHLARTREGLYALARVSFHGPGRKTLHGQVQVRFRAHPKRGGSR